MVGTTAEITAEAMQAEAMQAEAMQAVTMRKRGIVKGSIKAKTMLRTATGTTRLTIADFATATAHTVTDLFEGTMKDIGSTPAIAADNPTD
jgi:hypothetical protein